MPRVIARAAIFWSGAIESSRSRISASAAVFLALSNFRVLSPGTNRNERMVSGLWFAMHQSGAAAAGDHLAPLIGRGVLEFDDTLSGPRFAGALGDDLGVGLQSIAMEHRLRKFDVGHAEIADRGAERRVIHTHPDHDP